ncbi:Zinc finger protein [Quillaja saponaria]|uniref:Zinc finger protein n=1 Tax=Quillaja saponaria TaxID=32244 RepID=A0AAD7Q082_QUISA|nr:Zinc finger protein [Quillaja saponaria]
MDMDHGQEEEFVVDCSTAQIMIKGKRTSKRQRLTSPIRLTMSSTTSSGSRAGFDHPAAAATTTTSSEFRDSSITTDQEEEDMANCLILLAQGHHFNRKVLLSHPVQPANTKTNATATGLYHVYQCKTCNRCFNSFQALGGHRASHKKPKQPDHVTLLTSITDRETDDHVGHGYDMVITAATTTDLSLQIPNTGLYNYNNGGNSTKKKIHECSICGAEFSSGQALGGHMRRHRTLVNTTTTSSSTTTIAGIAGSPEFQEFKKPRNGLKLDLNLPASPEDHEHRESKFAFQSKEQVLVFSASPLVDCHY